MEIQIEVEAHAIAEEVFLELDNRLLQSLAVVNNSCLTDHPVEPRFDGETRVARKDDGHQPRNRAVEAERSDGRIDLGARYQGMASAARAPFSDDRRSSRQS